MEMLYVTLGTQEESINVLKFVKASKAVDIFLYQKHHIVMLASFTKHATIQLSILINEITVYSKYKKVISRMGLHRFIAFALDKVQCADIRYFNFSSIWFWNPR